MERRSAVVLSCTPGSLRLRYSSRCSACAGCGGRCQVFTETVDSELELRDGAWDPLNFVAGQTVELEVPRALLLRQAALGYGLPLLGLLLGAVVGSPFGNLATALGALLGTWLAVALSKRAFAVLPSPRLRLPADSP